MPLSGPLGLTALGVASAFSQVLGKEVRVREVNAAGLNAALTGAGASPKAAGELDSIYNDTSQGEWSIPTQTLEELLGHDRVPLVEALEAAHPEAGGRPAGGRPDRELVNEDGPGMAQISADEVLKLVAQRHALCR